MPIGPGKYGARAEAILRETGGELCLVIVLEGAKGPSFDCATANPALLDTVPGILRIVADSLADTIERDKEAMLADYLATILRRAQS